MFRQPQLRPPPLPHLHLRLRLRLRPSPHLHQKQEKRARLPDPIVASSRHRRPQTLFSLTMQSLPSTLTTQPVATAAQQRPGLAAVRTSR